MGMSTYVYGLKEPTERYVCMSAVRQNCILLGIDEPPEVEAFFDNAYGYDESGERIDLPKDSYKEWTAEMQHGYQVEISKLPSEVKYVRFVNSY